MYAIIASGGKQHRVTEGQCIKLEKLPVEVDQQVDFNDVLMVSAEETVQVGEPHVPGAKVLAKVISHGRHRKINILKFKRRKQYMKRQGHRQDYTEVLIEKIETT